MPKASKFEDLYKKLEKIVEEFEKGDIDIADGIKKFEEAMTIAKKLKEYLKDVDLKIKEIKNKFEDN